MQDISHQAQNPCETLTNASRHRAHTQRGDCAPDLPRACAWAGDGRGVVEEFMSDEQICKACAGKGCWRYSDHRFHSTELVACPISVCPLCVGTGLMPDYPEFQPVRPPSHFAFVSPSWCLNSAFCASDGHMPCTTMLGILRHLSSTGDVWRMCSEGELERKCPVFWIRKVLPFSSESRGVATFCREWRSVFNWEDQDGRSMRRIALEVRKDTFKGRYTTGEVMTIPPPLPK
jgi:hypothetical protein